MKTSSTKRAVFVASILLILGVIDTNNIALAQGSKTFNNPVISGYRLDWCLHWSAQCGKPAADTWCRRKMGKAGGYALKWKEAVDIGTSSPTMVMGDKKVCSQQFCDGFEWINCGYSLD